MDRSGGAYQGLVSGKGLFFDATPSGALSRMSPLRKKGRPAKPQRYYTNNKQDMLRGGKLWVNPGSF